jgi:hypothetical protein
MHSSRRETSEQQVDHCRRNSPLVLLAQNDDRRKESNPDEDQGEGEIVAKRKTPDGPESQ